MENTMAARKDTTESVTQYQVEESSSECGDDGDCEGISDDGRIMDNADSYADASSIGISSIRTLAGSAVADGSMLVLNATQEDVARLLEEAKMKDLAIREQEEEIDDLQAENIMLRHQLQQTKDHIVKQQNEITGLKRELAVSHHKDITGQRKLNKAKSEINRIKRLSLEIDRVVNNGLNGLEEEEEELTERIESEMNDRSAECVSPQAPPPLSSSRVIVPREQSAYGEDNAAPGSRRKCKVRRRSKIFSSTGEELDDENQQPKSNSAPILPTRSNSVNRDVVPSVVPSVQGQSTAVRHAIGSTENGIFVCICGCRYQTENRLLGHIGKFNFSKKYKCDVCSKEFFNSRLFKKHTLSHGIKNGTRVLMRTRQNVLRQSGGSNKLAGTTVPHTKKVPPKFTMATNVYAKRYPEKQKLHNMNFTRRELKHHKTIAHKIGGRGSGRKGASRFAEVNSSSDEETEAMDLMEPEANDKETQAESVVSSEDNPEEEQDFHEADHQWMSGSQENSSQLLVDEIKTEPEDVGPSWEDSTTEEELHGPVANQPLQCVCGKKLKTEKSLHVHIRVKSGFQPFRCEVCAETFALACSLKYHLRRVHQLEVPRKTTWCGSCGKKCPSMKMLRRHRLIVHNDGPRATRRRSTQP